MTSQAQITAFLADVGTLTAHVNALVPDTATPPPPPPPPQPTPTGASWARLGGGGPNSNQGWWRAQCLADGRGWVSCGSIPSTYTFDPNSGQWTHTNTDTTHFYKNLGAAENYELAYDPVGNIIYKSLGSPNAWHGTNENDGPHYGELRYVVALDEFFTDYPAGTVTWRPATPDAIAHWDINGLGKTFTQADCCYEYWNGALYAFGSFTIGALGLRKRDLTTGAVTTLEAYKPKTVLGPDGFPAFPQWTLGSGRTPELNAGIDKRNGMAWTLADDCELYMRDLSLPPNVGFKHIVTTGDKPTDAPPGDGSTGTYWGADSDLNEAENCIVVWIGKNAVVGTTGMQVIDKLWILPLDTLVWKLVTPTGLPPPAQNAVAQSFLYNAARRKMWLFVAAGVGMDVWELTLQ